MSNRWLVFSFSLPARQQSLRVKALRRLAAIGAVTLKNSLHLLPDLPACREHLGWLSQEVEASEGEAALLTCTELGAVSAEEARQLFRAARDADYADLEAEAGSHLALLTAQPADDGVQAAARAFQRKAQRRLAAIMELDFFPSGRGQALGATLDSLADALDYGIGGDPQPSCRAQDYQGRTWVTRERPYIDRLSSFWLIKRRIDADAAILLIAADSPIPQDAATTFDMPGADFTHRAGLVTFEVLAQDFGIKDAAVRRLRGIVKAIDLADGEGDDGLPAEARAVKDVLDGLVRISKDDSELLERAMVLFDALAATYTPTPGA